LLTAGDATILLADLEALSAEEVIQFLYLIGNLKNPLGCLVTLLASCWVHNMP